MLQRSFSSLMPLTRLRQRASSGDSGAAAVEFALIVPIFLVLVFGVIEFSFMFNQQSAINSAGSDVSDQTANAPSGRETVAKTVMLQNSKNLVQGDYFYLYQPDANGDPIAATDPDPCPYTSCILYDYINGAFVKSVVTASPAAPVDAAPVISDNNDYVQITKTDYTKEYANNSAAFFLIDKDATLPECNNTATATKYPIGKSNFHNGESDKLIPLKNDWTIEATILIGKECSAKLYWMKPTVSNSSYTTGTPAVTYNYQDPSVIKTIATTTDYFIGSVKTQTKTVTTTYTCAGYSTGASSGNPTGTSTLTNCVQTNSSTSTPSAVTAFNPDALNSEDGCNIGIYVSARHGWLTGTQTFLGLGAALDLEASSVSALRPGVGKSPSGTCGGTTTPTAKVKYDKHKKSDDKHGR
ncbi:MAG: pilus assembly protein [Actinobacteria bacterium]|nr:pilus assembly protein [Actinomycetota bacterium]